MNLAATGNEWLQFLEGRDFLSLLVNRIDTGFIVF